MTIIKFPVIGIQMDRFIEKIWAEIRELPDDVSVSSIIGALEIVKFDIIEGMKKQ